MGELKVRDEQGHRTPTDEEMRQLQEKKDWDKAEQAAIEESFARFEAAQARAEDRDALLDAMNHPQLQKPKRMRLRYELRTTDGVSVAHGSHDVLVEQEAQLEVTVAVQQVENAREGLPAVTLLRPDPAADEAEAAEPGNELEEPDVGSVEFDEAVILSSQELAPVAPLEPLVIPGCPRALSHAYFTLYLDESITEELITDRFGVEVLRMFQEHRLKHVAALERGDDGAALPLPSLPGVEGHLPDGMEVVATAADEEDAFPLPEIAGNGDGMPVEGAGAQPHRPGALYDSREVRVPEPVNSAENVVHARRPRSDLGESSNVLRQEATNDAALSSGCHGYGGLPSDQMEGLDVGNNGGSGPAASAQQHLAGDEVPLAGSDAGAEPVPGALLRGELSGEGS